MWEGEPPSLRSPVFVAAFAGWNDAATAATTAVEAVAVGLETQVVARVDPAELFDFQVNRPTIRLTDGETRHVEWPSNALVAARAPGAERDLILPSGIEPNLRWRTFSNAILDAARAMGAEMVVTLGSLIADVAHTRSVP